MPDGTTEICAILAEPIPANEYGLAYLAGCVACRVDINDLTEKQCGIQSGSTTLETRSDGPHYILWQDTGLGVVRCLVAMGSPLVSTKTVKIGVAANNITAGGSGTINIWRNGVLTSPLETETAQLDWMHGSEDISQNKQVVITWFPDESVWRITGAECET